MTPSRSALRPDEVDRVRDEALAAIAAAADLDELKQAAPGARRGPLAARARQPGDRRAAARGPRRGRQARRRRPRRGRRGAEGAPGRTGGRARRSASSSRRPSTSPCRGTAPAGRPPPADHHQERMADVFVSMGFEVAEGPEVEAEWFNFDALNFTPDHPARDDAGHLLRRARRSTGLVLRTHTSPVQIRALLTRELPVLRRCAGRARSAPTSWTPRTARSSTRWRAWRSTRASRWPTCAARIDAFVGGMFGGGLRPGSARPTSPSPSRRPRWTCSASCAAARRPSPAPTRAGPAAREGWIELGRLRHGQPARAGGLRRRPRALQRLGVRASASSGR